MKKFTLLILVSLLTFFNFFAFNAYRTKAQERETRKTPEVREPAIVRNLDRWQEQSQRWSEKWNKELKVGPNDVRERNRERFCSNIKPKLDARWQRYYQNRSNQLERIQQALLILQERIDYFNSKGLDTSELQKDLETLTKLVEEYKDAYSSFLSLLEEVKNLDCKNYENEFLPKLKQVKDAWLVVRAKREVIRNFYLNEIRPNLESLRNQLGK